MSAASTMDIGKRVAAYQLMNRRPGPLTAKQHRRIKHKENHLHAPFGKRADRGE